MTAEIKKPMQIGIYGGTFAPPHLGHIRAAEAFLREIDLDRLYIVPAFLPPHKELTFIDDPSDRLEMARLAFSHLPKTAVSDYEIRKRGKSYTVHTLEHFSSEGDLTFLCGTDMFLSLDRWYMPERIFELTRIALMRRETRTEELDRMIDAAADRYIRDYGARISIVSAPVLELASTDVRAALCCGGDTSTMLSPEVECYVRDRGLYGITGK